MHVIIDKLIVIEDLKTNFLVIVCWLNDCDYYREYFENYMQSFMWIVYKIYVILYFCMQI